MKQEFLIVASWSRQIAWLVIAVTAFCGLIASGAAIRAWCSPMCER